MMHNLTLTVRCGPFLPARIRRMSVRRRKLATQRWLTELLIGQMPAGVSGDAGVRAAVDRVVESLLVRMRPRVETSMVAVAQ